MAEFPFERGHLVGNGQQPLFLIEVVDGKRRAFVRLIGVGCLIKEREELVVIFVADGIKFMRMTLGAVQGDAHPGLGGYADAILDRRHPPFFIVGASLGASLALLAVAQVPQVRAIALLSPSLDYRGLRTDNSLIKRLGARSIWLAASDQDPLALRSLRDIAAEPSGPREQHVSSVLAHGTVLLDKDGDVARSLVDWLRRSLLS